MEGTFQKRLEEVFGALSSGGPSWSVSGSEVERRQWRASVAESDDEDEEPPNPVLQVVDENDDKARKKTRREWGDDDEEMEVQDMVGMDTVLDSEDEEDEYDQVAMCKKSRSKLYMKEFGEDTDYFDNLPTNLGELKRLPRDTRAFHQAAATRLAEDRKEAEMRGTKDFFKAKTGVLDPSVGSINSTASFNPEGKRKDDQRGEATKEKRVRFANGTKAAVPMNQPQVPKPETEPRAKDPYRNVPDHVKHPEKYTHYFLDWSEDDGANANTAAFHATMDALKRQNAASGMEEDSELPKSITFVPRAKRAEKANTSSTTRKPSEATSMAATDEGTGGDIDGDGISSTSGDRVLSSRSRSYRARTTDDE